MMLIEQEFIILNYVHEFLDKNRQFEYKKILPFIISRLRMSSININVNGIEEILKSLVRKKYIIEGLKLTKEQILLNENRNIIFNHIVRNPGTYTNKIIKDLGISNHVVVWHLNMLLKFEFIRVEKVEKHKIYFEFFIEPEKAKALYFTSKEKSKKIFNYLKENDTGLSKTQLSNELKIHFNTISKYINALEELKLIVKKRLKNKTLYIINED